jgi:geranylgeranyl pyrophosphate synthase
VSPNHSFTQYLTSVYDLVEGVPHDVLEGGLLLELIETVLRGLRAENEEEASFLLLPIWTCQAAGGPPGRAVPISAAWCLLHTAALLLDDVQDRELALKPWPEMSPSQAINVATALIFCSQLSLGYLGRQGTEAALALDVWQAFSREVLNVCAGQQLDLCDGALSLDGYWQMAGGKSGAFFSLACRAGAMLGTRDRSSIDGYAEFGYNLGVLVQVSDDFNGVWNAPGPGDLVPGTQTLPVIYVLSVGSEQERACLLGLLQRTPLEIAAVQRARQLIADLGGVHYLIVQAEAYRRRAQSALPPPNGACAAYDRLVDLLGRVMSVLGTNM